MMATALAVAFVLYSCNGKLAKTEDVDFENTPVQTVDDMYIVQTENGGLQSRVEANRMERYSKDDLSYDLFPDGIAVYAYTDEGLLETEITALEARHLEYTDGKEIWEAYGNVIIKNLINQEVMRTDTIYWNRKDELIYTDCFVQLESPKGFMQGFGMESDQRARHSIIRRPFDSYGYVDQDSTAVQIDTANFIGPMMRKDRDTTPKRSASAAPRYTSGPADSAAIARRARASTPALPPVAVDTVTVSDTMQETDPLTAPEPTAVPDSTAVSDTTVAPKEGGFENL